MRNCGVATKKPRANVAALAIWLADEDFHMPLFKETAKIE